MYYVYTLTDPRNNHVKYVGMSKNPTLRLTQHMTEYASKEKRKWIDSLISENKMPILDVVFNHETEKEARDEETYLINTMISFGFELVNRRDNHKVLSDDSLDYPFFANMKHYHDKYYFGTLSKNDSRQYYGRHSVIKSAAYMYAKRKGIKLSAKMILEKNNIHTLITRIK